MPPPGDLVQIVGVGALQRIIIPSSFVATIDTKKPKTTADFHIGKGGWIVQAKANIRASSTEFADVQLILSATTDTIIEDRAKASVYNIGYATVVAMLGFRVSSTALVHLELSLQGKLAENSADIEGIVITAIRQDDLTVLAL
jgi:hypothetical protein